MFTLFGVFTLMTVAAARPGVLQSESSLATIGSIVNHIPTAITHQSRTEIHNQQPVISSILAPVLRTVLPVQTILQQQTPIISSQIQSSPVLLGEQVVQGLTTGQESIVGGEATLLNDQRAILQSQGSLIGGQSIIVGDNSGLIENGATISAADGIINSQNSIIGNSGLLVDNINTSGIQLNDIKALSH